ncbi:uncharacterized protein LOC119634368 [Glossina fuscipes]|uniref:Uncharacterized protein LOC119634368 n=1 Tax=Glossina fuscipes TaxID=7396 RepID=A0A8U0WH12_9MUSC|nr:uncharacterized protein LOC119634368 [Glossina fuscipes]KAI9584716.1 hypothetical protein GQX74_006611 [Glossina fuscipes]
MFKKSRNHKTLAPPIPPSIEEIREDMKTFQIDVEPQPNSTSNSLETWWYTFEQFINDLKCLKMLESEIADYKVKLETRQIEIDTEAKLLKNEIEEQKQHIDSIID